MIKSKKALSRMIIKWLNSLYSTLMFNESIDWHVRFMMITFQPLAFSQKLFADLCCEDKQGNYRLF